MLAGWRELGDVVVNPAAVELAIWYHDAIYDPAAIDNEARSAACPDQADAEPSE